MHKRCPALSELTRERAKPLYNTLSLLDKQTAMSLNDHMRAEAILGNLGHLTEDQQAQFTTFRTNLEKASLYTPPTTTAPSSHDDATLLRFLRARRFDPLKAQQQFAATEDWRKTHSVDALYATFPTQEFERAKLFYPRWTGRRDKQGVPVYVYKLSALTGEMQKELNQVPTERRYQRIVSLWEFMRLFTLPLCSALPHPDPQPPTPTTPLHSQPNGLPNGQPNDITPPLTSKVPITSVTSIIDLGDVSLGTMWSLRHHLQQASELATAHYPETLHRIAVVNAPSFFGTVWGWIKVWFDEGTRNKVHVLDSNPGPTLLTLIDTANLPRTYGGELDFQYEDAPVLDDAAKKALGTDSVPRGPVIFKGDGWARPAGWKEEEAAPPPEKVHAQSTTRSRFSIWSK
ncbi:CRAL-TRIO domain-containing protein [Amylostereum chailletii]|nr:CRAL-TRIO domain-containing protein [Amylostereum chailletii]